MTHDLRRILLALLVPAASATLAQDRTGDGLTERARTLARTFTIIDTHIDVPMRLHHAWEDLSTRTAEGDFDFVRAKAGGLDAPFMSVYIPSEYEGRGAKALADTLIGLVERMASTWPKLCALARSPADVEANSRRGLVSLALGMENGSPIEGDLANIRWFHQRGIRYITLTHGEDNHISDSSYDTTRTWGGLSPFGRTAVREMNRVGIMVDVSHVTDEAFTDVLEVTRAPIIASHSSCRAFTPGFERNMSDSMIVALARTGGVIMINFGSSFLSGEYLQKEEAGRRDVIEYLRAHRLSYGDQQARDYIARYRRDHPLPTVTVSAVADHIDHVVRLVGVDHVGIGSDFDGVGDSLPEGLKDVSGYPNLLRELLARGYSEEAIQKICSGNIMRVWNEVERVAASWKE